MEAPVRLIAAGCVLACLALAPAASAAAHRADGRLGDWRGKPTNVSGQTVLSRGELVYTDWIYDDYGPNLDGFPNGPPEQEMGGFNPTMGDYRYPADPARYGYNAADLRELRVAADRSGLHVLFGLETLKQPNAAIATLAIDGDRSPATSAAEWPDGARIDTPGPERFVTSWGTGARVTTPSGTTRVKTAVNLKDNAIEIDVPWSALGKVGPRLRIWAVTGIDDGNGRYARPPVAGPLPIGALGARTGVYNVAFRPDEPLTTTGSGWNENEQAAALVTRNVSRFHADVDLAQLKRGASRSAAPLRPGFHVRLFRSRYDLGDGLAMVTGNDQFDGLPEMRSRWQPYGVYVPKGFRRGGAMTLWVHSGFANHTQFPRIGPHLFEQLGDDRRALVVIPLNRGGDTGALDAGLADILEAMGDAERRFAVDRTRVTVAGQSEGGYGAYRLALLMPDRFARAAAVDGLIAQFFWPYPAPVVTTPKWQTVGNTNLIVPNARNVPFQMTHVAGDAIVPLTAAQHQADTFRDAGDPYRFIVYAALDHFSSVQVDEWSRERQWLTGARIDRNPREVVFKRYPAMDLPRFGLRFDRAYWLSGVRARRRRGRGDYALVRATTYGRGGLRSAPDPFGPRTVVTPVRGPGTMTGQTLGSGSTIPRRNRLDARLTNTSHATFALKRMDLSPRRCLVTQVTSDGRATLVLRGRFPRVQANRRVRRARRYLSFEVRDGATRLRVCPRPRASLRRTRKSS